VTRQRAGPGAGKSEIRISKSETNPNIRNAEVQNGGTGGCFPPLGESGIRAGFAPADAGGHSRESGNRISCFEFAHQGLRGFKKKCVLAKPALSGVERDAQIAKDRSIRRLLSSVVRSPCFALLASWRENLLRSRGSRISWLTIPWEPHGLKPILQDLVASWLCVRLFRPVGVRSRESVGTAHPAT
jgi:hypothetical protein